MMIIGMSKVCEAQWLTVLDSSNYRFSNVYFINNDTGFVCGEKIGQPWSVIARTMDGGQTWSFSSGIISFMSIQFVNDSIGFAGGQDGYIYKTINLGATWNLYSTISPMNDHSAFYFINSLIGFTTSFSGILYKTIDGGLSWTYAFSSTGESYFPGTAKFFFVDTQIGYVSQSGQGQQGFNGKSISKTIDGGANWIDLPIPSNYNPYSCFFFDSLSGFSVGAHGKVTKTNDGGLTWTTPDSICPFPLYDIVFVNDSIGYITGGYNDYEYFGSNNGIVFKTIDRGNTWQIMDSTFSNGLTKMHFPSPSVGYAVGMGGVVLKLTEANSPYTKITQLTNFISSITLYPNPTKGIFNIESTAVKLTSIKIMNVMGKVIKNYEFGIKNVSNTTIDMSNESKGIYFVQTIDEKKNVVNKKIVIQ